MTYGINITGDLPRYALDRVFYNLTDKSYWTVDDRNQSEQCWYASTNHSWDKVDIPTENRSVLIAFVMSVIEKFTELPSTLMIKVIGASLSSVNVLLPQYRKIKLFCCNLDLKWRSRFTYKVAGNTIRPTQCLQRSRGATVYHLFCPNIESLS